MVAVLAPLGKAMTCQQCTHGDPCVLLGKELAFGQAVFNYFSRLGWDPVREEHLELHH